MHSLGVQIVWNACIHAGYAGTISAANLAYKDWKTYCRMKKYRKLLDEKQAWLGSCSFSPHSPPSAFSKLSDWDCKIHRIGVHSRWGDMSIEKQTSPGFEIQWALGYNRPSTLYRQFGAKNCKKQRWSKGFLRFALRNPLDHVWIWQNLYSSIYAVFSCCKSRKPCKHWLFRPSPSGRIFRQNHPSGLCPAGLENR